jgi:leader peptidase (prepilin peptidase) / N-methyltransferase
MIQSDLVLAALIFVLGVIFGSFGNVLIYRLPKNESIGGRSRCPHDGQPLATWDLVPIISYLILRGRCRRCSEKISLQYPLVELASGGLFLIAWSLTDAVSATIFLAFSLWLLLLMGVIDAQTQTIPDVLNFPFVLFAMAYGFFSGTLEPLAPLLTCTFFGLQWAVSRGKWVGSGDIILAAGVGALAGTVPRAFFLLTVTYVIGAVIALILLATGRKTHKDALAFVPFLAIGTLCTLLFADDVFNVVFGL